MTPEAIQSALRDQSFSGVAPFELLRQVATLHNEHSSSSTTLDAIIRTLDRRNDFPDDLQPIIDGLVLSAGLYPCVDQASLGVEDGLAVELNRPLSFGSDVVFHHEQNLVYRHLLDGRSVILSAPTSFGKSLVIDGVIASGTYENIVVVVPTIALIDETRRRLQKFRDAYRVITHGSQSQGHRNIFVLTQERVLDFTLPDIDFFVIDEFYKLGMEQDADRASLLNLAFYRLRKTAKAFYLLGPSIQAITAPVQTKVNAEFIATDFRTVASDIILIPKAQRTLDHLIELCKEQSEPTLIFTRSPNGARAVGKALAEEVGNSANPMLNEAADWVGSEYHPEWSYATCLRAGIGLHHGRIPRALQQLSVRLFHEGLLKYLACTSTLIEGVNTAAKTVIIYDSKIATKKYDFFTFNNIKVRAGRMRQHFIGRVFLFNDPPSEELPMVDIPIVSQPDDLPLQVVVEMDEADLTQGSIDRLGDVLNQSVLPSEIIRANVGVDPERQVEFARMLRGRSLATMTTLAWSGYPTSAQRLLLCQVLWEGFLKFQSRVSGAYSAAQLNRSLTIASRMTVKDWIDKEVVSGEKEPDRVVEDILDFARNYCGFRFPRYARAAERIIKHELARRNLGTANYAFFINQVEALFLPPIVSALDEFGVPTQIASMLNGTGALSDDIDEAVQQVEAAAKAGILSEFESKFVLGALGIDEVVATA
ncbi:MAG: DEAD/DEAH box helicase [Fimbriimonadaceae bacterium]|nr:DEAD/DEAH box helicase [Fimbriimonadaceae bacterium]